MLALLQVVAPVFLVTAAGYAAVWLGYVKDSHIDGLNRFSQGVAIPCLLFNAAMTLDLGRVFDWRLLGAFYAGATVTFVLGILGARLLFGRRPGESVVIGFGSLFSNSVVLGLPITERAFGAEALQAAYAIISIHAPYCYLLGITVMEISRADGRGARATAQAVVQAMARNALMAGIALGFAFNLAGLRPPGAVADALEILVASALPTALFGLGGVLTRYALRSIMGEAAMTSGLSLLVHPAIAFALAHWVLDLPTPFVQGAVIIAAMAPGVNTYIFATLYRRSEGAAAGTVVMATLLSVLTISAWLSVLYRL